MLYPTGSEAEIGSGRLNIWLIVILEVFIYFEYYSFIS
jgi:hypothetical protein